MHKPLRFGTPPQQNSLTRENVELGSLRQDAPSKRWHSRGWLGRSNGPDWGRSGDFVARTDRCDLVEFGDCISQKWGNLNDSAQAPPVQPTRLRNTPPASNKQLQPPTSPLLRAAPNAESLKAVPAEPQDVLFPQRISPAVAVYELAVLI